MYVAVFIHAYIVARTHGTHTLQFILLQVAFPSGTVRWFDFPFTREESLTADKSFKIYCKYYY